MRREVQAFVVHCTFMDDGCKLKGEVIEAHKKKTLKQAIHCNLRCTECFSTLCRLLCRTSNHANFLAFQFVPLLRITCLW